MRFFVHSFSQCLCLPVTHDSRPPPDAEQAIPAKPASTAVPPEPENDGIEPDSVADGPPGKLLPWAKGKLKSLSTLSAWRILARDIAESAEVTAEEDVPQEDPHPLGPRTAPAPSFEGWDMNAVEGSYDLGEELGRGAFGRVVRARRRADGAPACVKLLNSVGDPFSTSALMDAAKEVSILRSLRHPNIVRVLGAHFDPGSGRVAIAMELCAGGDLEAWLKDRRRRGCEYLPEAQVMRLFVQMALALAHVHAAGVHHRDVKPSNVFIDGFSKDTDGNLLPQTVKLGDFGIAKSLSPESSLARTMVGTPTCLSPEILSDLPYSRKSDVWALGCVLYELCALRQPFQGSSMSAVAVKILASDPPPLPETASPALRSLVSALLTKDPKARPSMKEVLSMPLVQDHLARYLAETPEAVVAVEATSPSYSSVEAAKACSDAVTVVKKDSPTPPGGFLRAATLKWLAPAGGGRRVADVECRGELEEGEVQYAFAS